MHKDEVKNMPDAVLADMLGSLDAQSKLLNKQLKLLKDEVKDRARTLEGNSHTVSISDSVRWSLNTALIKEEMSEEWVTSHSKTAHVKTVQIRNNAQLVAA